MLDEKSLYRIANNAPSSNYEEALDEQLVIQHIELLDSIKKANKYFEQKDYVNAIKQYSCILEFHPDYKDAKKYKQEAEKLLTAEQEAQALKKRQEEEERRKEDARRKEEERKKEERRKDVTELLEKIIDNSTESIECHCLGEKFYRQGKYDEAIKEYNQAINLNPTNAKFYIDRGISYRHKHDWKKAKEDFAQAAKQLKKYYKTTDKNYLSIQKSIQENLNTLDKEQKKYVEKLLKKIIDNLAILINFEDKQSKLEGEKYKKEQQAWVKALRSMLVLYFKSTKSSPITADIVEYFFQTCKYEKILEFLYPEKKIPKIHCETGTKNDETDYKRELYELCRGMRGKTIDFDRIITNNNELLLHYGEINVQCNSEQPSIFDFYTHLQALDERHAELHKKTDDDNIQRMKVLESMGYCDLLLQLPFDSGYPIYLAWFGQEKGSCKKRVGNKVVTEKCLVYKVNTNEINNEDLKNLNQQLKENFALKNEQLQGFLHKITDSFKKVFKDKNITIYVKSDNDNSFEVVTEIVVDQRLSTAKIVIGESGITNALGLENEKEEQTEKNCYPLIFYKSHKKTNDELANSFGVFPVLIKRENDIFLYGTIFDEKNNGKKIIKISQLPNCEAITKLFVEQTIKIKKNNEPITVKAQNVPHSVYEAINLSKGHASENKCFSVLNQLDIRNKNNKNIILKTLNKLSAWISILSYDDNGRVYELFLHFAKSLSSYCDSDDYGQQALEIIALLSNKVTKQHVEDKVKNYPFEWHQDRECLATLRKKFNAETAQFSGVMDFINPQKVFNQGLKAFTHSLFDDCFDLLGKPPIKICIVALGSMARKDCLPYSDFEYAILTSTPIAFNNDGTANLNNHDHPWLKLFLQLFAFRIRKIGEYKNPEYKLTGFHIDDGGHLYLEDSLDSANKSNSKYFIGTPEQLMLVCSNLANPDGSKKLIYALYTADYLWGDATIWQTYQVERDKHLKENCSKIAIRLFNDEKTKWNDRHELSKNEIDIKHNFTAPLCHFINILYLANWDKINAKWNQKEFVGNRHAGSDLDKSPANIIDQLCETKILNLQFGKELKKAFYTLQRYRAKAQFEQQHQPDQEFIKDQEALDYCQKVNREIFMPISRHWHKLTTNPINHPVVEDFICWQLVIFYDKLISVKNQLNKKGEVTISNKEYQAITQPLIYAKNQFKQLVNSKLLSAELTQTTAIYRKWFDDTLRELKKSSFSDNNQPSSSSLKINFGKPEEKLKALQELMDVIKKYLQTNAPLFDINADNLRALVKSFQLEDQLLDKGISAEKLKDMVDNTKLATKIKSYLNKEILSRLSYLLINNLPSVETPCRASLQDNSINLPPVETPYMTSRQYNEYVQYYSILSKKNKRIFFKQCMQRTRTGHDLSLQKTNKTVGTGRDLSIQNEINNKQREMIESIATDFPSNDGYRPNIESKRREFDRGLEQLVQFKETAVKVDYIPLFMISEEKTPLEKLFTPPKSGFLSAEVIKQIETINQVKIFELENIFKQLKPKGTSSNHYVIEVKLKSLEDDKEHAYYLKFYPESFGGEFAAQTLYDAIIGYGTSTSALVKFTINGKTYPVMISEKVVGSKVTINTVGTGRDLSLQNTPEINLNDIKLNPQQFTQLFLMNILAPQEDGKPNNYVFDLCKKLICIDNDHAFGCATKIESSYLGLKTTETTLTKTIVFCLNNMHEQLDKTAINHFLKLDPYNTLNSWINKMEIYASAVEKLFDKNDSTNWANEKVDLNSYLKNSRVYFRLPHDLLSNLYQRMVMLQRLIKQSVETPVETPYRASVQRNSINLPPVETMASPQCNYTHLELLKIMEPKLGKHYEALLTTPKSSPSQRCTMLFNGNFITTSRTNEIYDLPRGTERPSSLLTPEQQKFTVPQLKGSLTKIHDVYPQIYAINQQVEANNLSEFAKLPLLRGNVGLYFQTQIINKLNWKNISTDLYLSLGGLTSNQQIILEALLKPEKEFKQTKLTLLNCAGLSDKALRAILTNKQHLQVLCLDNCDNLNQITIPPLSHLRKLKITNCKNLQSINFIVDKQNHLSNLVQFKNLTHFELRNNAKLTTVKNLYAINIIKYTTLKDKDDVPFTVSNPLLREKVFDQNNHLSIPTKWEPVISLGLSKPNKINFNQTYLSWINISDEGAKVIAEVIKTNTTLMNLNLGNNIGDEGTKVIIEALKTNKVTCVNFSNNKVDISKIPTELRNRILFQNEQQEYSFKVICVGGGGVGVTFFVRRYIHNDICCYIDNGARRGVNFYLKVLQLPKSEVRLQMWSIGAQERFSNMTRVYYKEAVAAVIICDATRRDTLKDSKVWSKDIDAKVFLPNGRLIPKILIINKCDLDNTITYEQCEETAKEIGALAWFKCSAKKNININESMDFLVKAILGTVMNDVQYADEVKKFQEKRQQEITQLIIEERKNQQVVEKKEQLQIFDEKIMQKNNKPKEYSFKVVCVSADCRTGSSFIARYARHEALSYMRGGIGSITKKYCIDQKTIELELWDMPSQERFQVAVNFSRLASAVIITYECTDLDSFVIENAKKRSKRIDETSGPIIKIAVFYKCDLPNTATVEQCEKIAKEIGALAWFKCSAKTGENVNECMDFLVKAILGTVMNDVQYADEVKKFQEKRQQEITQKIIEEKNNALNAIKEQESKQLEKETIKIMMRSLIEEIEDKAIQESSQKKQSNVLQPMKVTTNPNSFVQNNMVIQNQIVDQNQKGEKTQPT